MCDVTPDLVTRLPMNGRAPAMARELTRRASCLTHHASITDVAELLVSELVTNAVKHGLPPIEFRIRCRDHELLEVAVADASPTPPLAPAADDGEAEHGRGLSLVDVLSDRWGVTPGEPGKQVWFQLRVDVA